MLILMLVLVFDNILLKLVLTTSLFPLPPFPLPGPCEGSSVCGLFKNSHWMGEFDSWVVSLSTMWGYSPNIGIYPENEDDRAR